MNIQNIHVTTLSKIGYSRPKGLPHANIMTPLIRLNNRIEE